MAQRKLTREQVEEIGREAREKEEIPDLSEVDLSGVDLGETNLNWANLIEADLSWTDLSDVDFSAADLSGAVLSRAILFGTHFIETDFSEVNLTYCQVGHTTFADVDLGIAKGLETVIHHGPSYIDIYTLSNSKGRIPEIFLRGIGVPETLITYLPSLLGQAIQYYSCFISYSSKDQEFAERLHNDLQAKGSAAGLRR